MFSLTWKKKDTVIWLGDFNYRIELDRETTIAAVQRGDLPMLYESDQVSAVHPENWLQVINDAVVKQPNGCWPNVPILLGAQNHL